MNRVKYETYHHLNIFPHWARPRKREVTENRQKRLLPDMNAVLWDMDKETGSVNDHVEMSGFEASSTALPLFISPARTRFGFPLPSKSKNGTVCAAVYSTVCGQKPEMNTQRHSERYLILTPAVFCDHKTT